jgi:uncharacterized membrane protein YedE/YeeE
MNGFTPVAAIAGGLLIGLAASVLLIFNGRIAGISGIVGEAMVPSEGGRSWRLLFIGGMLAGGLVLRVVAPSSFEAASGGPIWLAVIAGGLVGYGTRLGNGCTSGHGVCGIARFSWRSIVATVVFMVAGVATVFVARHVLGGQS